MVVWNVCRQHKPVPMIKKISIIVAIIVAFILGTIFHSVSAEAPIHALEQSVVPKEIIDPIKRYAYERVYEVWDETQWNAFEDLVQKESEWKPWKVNPYSGACGLGQSLPCSKMGLGENWKDNPNGQIDWTIEYVRTRYKTPVRALAKWKWNCVNSIYKCWY